MHGSRERNRFWYFSPAMRHARHSVQTIARAVALLLVMLFAPHFANEARAAGPKSEPAAAPTSAQLQAARELFADATKDEDAGQWEAALAKLRRVAAVKLTAGTRYHIALCEEKLGLTATALAHYTEASQAAQREGNEEVIDLLKEPFLSDIRGRVPQLVLHVPADANEATLAIDGQAQPSGSWGVPILVDPGTHRIEAYAPGRRRFSREIAMRDRDVTVMDIALPVEAPPVAAKATVAPAPAMKDEPPAPRRGKGLAVVTTIGAVALAGGGFAAYFVSEGLQSDLRANGTTEQRPWIRAWDGIALGAWIGAAALGTAAVILWATPSRATQGGPRTRARLGVGSMYLEGSF
jgi:hypothetical protein